MKKIETGGPAFPTHELRFPDGVLSQEAEYGMSLRDYFAAKALLAYYSDGNSSDGSNAAKWSYEVADAMLKARK